MVRYYDEIMDRRDACFEKINHDLDGFIPDLLGNIAGYSYEELETLSLKMRNAFIKACVANYAHMSESGGDHPYFGEIEKSMDLLDDLIMGEMIERLTRKHPEKIEEPVKSIKKSIYDSPEFKKFRDFFAG